MQLSFAFLAHIVLLFDFGRMILAAVREARSPVQIDKSDRCSEVQMACASDVLLSENQVWKSGCFFL